MGKCDVCKGTGTYEDECVYCTGTGSVPCDCVIDGNVPRDWDNGGLCMNCSGSGTHECPSCHGSGTHSETCDNCNGSGRE